MTGHVRLNVIGQELERRAIVLCKAHVHDELRLVHGHLQRHVREPLGILFTVDLIGPTCQQGHSIAEAIEQPVEEIVELATKSTTLTNTVIIIDIEK